MTAMGFTTARAPRDSSCKSFGLISSTFQSPSASFKSLAIDISLLASLFEPATERQPILATYLSCAIKAKCRRRGPTQLSSTFG